MRQFKEYYKKEIAPKLKEQFGYTNFHAIPKVEKVVINIGASKALNDASYHEIMESVLKRISGQRPVKTLAKKSISNFKIREGMIVGYKATLRGDRMYDFIQKLVNITLPRVRDFQGLSRRCFDGHGNYCLGFKEYVAFPEIKSDEIEKLHGLEISISTSAKTDKEAYGLLLLLGFPFMDKEKDKKKIV